MSKLHGIFFNTPISENYIGHMMSEIYRDEIYKPFIKEGMTVLDIGANVGVTVYYFAQFAGTVWALEPSLEHFSVLTHMITHNQLENVVPINKAIFIDNQKLPLHHNKNRTMYSLHTAVGDPKLKPEMVQTISFDKLFKDYKIEHIDLLKLDIEGTEAEVLASDGFSQVADKISTVITEVHEWSGRHPNQVREALKNNGFTVEEMPSTANILVGRK